MATSGFIKHELRFLADEAIAVAASGIRRRAAASRIECGCRRCASRTKLLLRSRCGSIAGRRIDWALPIVPSLGQSSEERRRRAEKVFHGGGVGPDDEEGSAEGAGEGSVHLQVGSHEEKVCDVG